MRGYPESVIIQQKNDAWYIKLWYNRRHPFTAAILPTLSHTEQQAYDAAKGIAAAYGCTQWYASGSLWSRS